MVECPALLTDRAPLSVYYDQEVAVVLGPLGISEDGRTGVLTRRMGADQVVSIVPLTRGTLDQPMGPKMPHITELLRKAIEWRRQLDAREVRNQADIARREGITRGQVTQVLALLRLAPETREQIFIMSNTNRRPEITERRLRPVINGIEHAPQIETVPSLMP